MTAQAPVPAVPAATVLVVRDGAAGLEVLLVERHRRMQFGGGAAVFPGGKVDPGDAGDLVRAHCAGLDGVERAAAALRVAAVREVFEESGILLARAVGERELLSAGRARAVAARHRAAVAANRLALGELARRESLELATDLLVPFAHWVTPVPLPRRYDTHFFLIPAPPEQVATHDGGESVDAAWLTPRAALAAAAAGRFLLMFPTRLNLSKLARSANVVEAMAAAESASVVTVLPRVEAGPRGPVLRIPPEAGYDVVEAPLDEVGAGRR